MLTYAGGGNEEYRRLQARNIDALNHALAGLPEKRVRYHLCWGSWQGLHVHDLGLRDIVDLLFRVKAQAYSVEAATPHHSYEWRVVGRERVIAGADCEFAQGAMYQRQHPTVMWAKFEALVQGARPASERPWRS